MNDVVHQNTVCLLISGMKNNDSPSLFEVSQINICPALTFKVQFSLIN